MNLPLSRSMKFPPPEVVLYLYKSIVMSHRVVILPSWIYYICYKNRPVGLLVQHFKRNTLGRAKVKLQMIYFVRFTKKVFVNEIVR